MGKRKEQKLPRPTDTELAILRVLWQLGSGTVREVLKTINQGRKEEVGYTTVLKMLQIMTEKGLVYRDESQRPQVYRAKLSEDQTQRQFVSDLLDRVFDGSARKLVMQALAAKEVSDKELAQIEKLLDKMEGDGK
jgi:BlaI family transcriptional regulator, penicillinase repressor